MSKSPFEQAYERLPDDLKCAFDRWCKDAKVIEKGKDILQNIKSEKQLEIGVFTKFLECIAQSYTDTVKPKSVYEDTCRKYGFHFKGIKSQVSNSTVLHRVLNLKDLKEIIYQAMESAGYGPDDIEWTWDMFQELTKEDQMEILLDAVLYPPERIFWSYFAEKDAEKGTGIEPLVGKSADECCNILGIPTEWDKYDYGENIWKIHCRPSGAISRHVPTIADAGGWNSYFQPAAEKREDAKWGWTHPLKTPRGTKGLPEIVHKGWEFGTERGAFCDVPEDLGQR